MRRCASAPAQHASAALSDPADGACASAAEVAALDSVVFPAVGVVSDPSIGLLGGIMSVARITTLSSNSKTSFDAAIKEGVDRANKTLRNVTGAWVKEQKVEISDGAVVAWHVVLEVTFVLDD
jgi:flavin-binding protein dodecin